MIFFILSKLLSFLISPLTWILILLVSSLILKDKKISRKLLIITAIVFYFFTNSFIISEVLRLWEVQVTRDSELKPPYDVGIVLGGGMITYDDDYDRLTFRVNTDRILQAVALYKSGRIKKILISSGSGSLTYRDMLEASLLKRYLTTTLEIPDTALLIDSISDNTRQNALYSADILKKKYPHGKFLIITSATHIRRAMACFEKVGIHATPYSTDKITGKRRFYFNHLLLPNLDSIRHWELFLHEVVGYFVYLVMGYV